MPVIVAASGAEVEYYDPLTPQNITRRPRYPEECEGAAPHLDLARLDGSVDGVLQFVNRWGLLGLWACPAYQKAEGLPIRSQATNLRGEKYSTWYHHPHKMGRYRWQEPLPLFAQAVRDFQETLDELTRIPQAGDRALIVQLRFNERLKGIRPLANYEKQGWSIGWEFRSLLDVVHLLTLLDLLGGRTFRRCRKRRCGNIYLTKHPENQYCSDLCRKAHQIQRSRERRWADNIMMSHPDVDQAWLRKQVERLLEQGVSGEKRLKKVMSNLIATKKQEGS